MEQINIALRFLAASQQLLFLILIAFSNNPKRVRIVGAILMLGSISYLIMPMIEMYTPYMHKLAFLWYFGAIVPSLLLLLVWFIFEEHCQIPAWMLALVAFSMLASLYFQFTKVGLPGSPWWLHSLKALIAAIAMFIVWRGRDNDLVELRSKVRNVFIFALALMTFVIISVEVLTGFNPPLKLDLISVLTIFVFSLAFNYFFIKLNPSAQLMSLPAPVITETDDPLITQLLERMRTERLYADHDLRVGTLASMMNIPEYKLRNKINQQLGYRNFNQFVNHYRIEEAGVKLREDTRIPVLTVALDVGFRSISSFNSAFQAQFGVSPTKYRAEVLTES